VNAVAGVVVNYNARDHLLACVESLLSQEGLVAVVVVDNGSTDGSREALHERFPEVIWIDSGANLGYGAAANVGAACRSALGADLLVCNPDVELGPGALARLGACLEDRARVGVVGPRIVNSDGSLYPSARRFPGLGDALGHGLIGQFWPRNPWSRRYTMGEWDHGDEKDVDWLSGSCFLARRQMWEELGGFDVAYFMYMEDVDFCWRARQAGWQVVYEPLSDGVHVQGASADRHPYKMLVAHHVSMCRFAWRTVAGRGRWALPVVLCGLAGRFVVTACRRALVPAHGSARPVVARPRRE
jgi:N-acetylglucosaminyl-diphospho-decaprenol L-rhamnosyltransferase